MIPNISIELVMIILLVIIMTISIGIGLIQGFKKNMYYLCATVVFWVVFWITAPLVTGDLILDNTVLYSILLPLITKVDLGVDLSSCKTLMEGILLVIGHFANLSEEITKDPAVVHTLIALIQSIAKIFYLIELALNYFLFKIIIYHTVFKKYLKASKRQLKTLKNKNRVKPNPKLEKRIVRIEKRVKWNWLNTLLGIVSGSLRGVLTSFLILSLLNSTINLLPNLNKPDDTTASTENVKPSSNIYDFILDYCGDNQAVKTALDLIKDYQSSFLINTTGLKIGDKRADELFIDSILSGKSDDYSFELRDEVSSIIQIAEEAFYLTNGFDMESVQWTALSDSQVQSVEKILLLLSDTDIVNNLASVLVSVALSVDSVANNVPEYINKEDITKINWSSELEVIASLVSKVYSLGPDLATLDYFALDPVLVEDIFTSISKLDSLNFIAVIGSDMAIKSMIANNEMYNNEIANIEHALANMIVNKSVSEDIVSLSTLYSKFIDIYSDIDFDKYKDEQGNITNYISLLTSVDTVKYQGIVSTILRTNFISELLPDVLTIVKEEFIEKNQPEIASLINPSVVTSTQFEKEINAVLKIVGDILKDESGVIHPFETIETYDFSMLNNFTTKTVVESELLSYAMIKLFIDTSKGEGILKDNYEALNNMICVPDYLLADADSNHRFANKWYGNSANNYNDGELFIVLDTIKNCLSEIQDIKNPVSSIAPILSRINGQSLFESDVLYYSVNKLIGNYREYIVVPVSETHTSTETVNNEYVTYMINKEELIKVVNIFTDRNIIDLESLYVYVKTIEHEDGSKEEILVSKEEADDSCVVKFDLSVNKILGLLTSDKLYNPDDINDNGKNINKIFASKTLRASLSNMLTNMLKDAIVVPSNSIETSDNDCLILDEESNLVSKSVDIIRQDQFSSLLMAIKDLDIDLTILTEENANYLSIIDSFKNENGELKEEVNPIFGNVNNGYASNKYSGILHATVSKYIIEFSTTKSEDNPLVVPDESLDELDNSLIKPEEMVNLFKSVVLIGVDSISGGMNNEAINEIISTVIEHNEILDSNIIKATLTNFIVSSPDISENIPNGAYDQNIVSKKVIERQHFSDLLIAVDSLKTNSNADNYMDMLDVNNLTVSVIVKSNKNNEISNSLIVRGVLTNQLIKQSITIPDSAKQDDVVSVNELNSLINVAGQLLPNDSSFANMDLSSVKMGDLQEAKEDIKDSTIIKSILTSTLTKADSVIIVPEGALVDDIISNDEVDYLINGLVSLLGEESSLTSIDINTINLKSLKDNASTIANSYILNATLTKQIASINAIKVPSLAYEDTQRLTVNEFNHLLSGITTLLGDDTTLNNINVDSILLDDVSSASNDVASSYILNATITDKLIAQSSVIVIPSQAILENNDNPSDPTMLTVDEMGKFIDGLSSIVTGNINNISMDNISLLTLNDNSSKIYSSYVLNATITKQINKIDDIKVPSSSKHESVDNALKESEIENIFLGLYKLFGDVSINNIDINQLSISKINTVYKDESGCIKNCKVLMATITHQIDKLKGSNFLIVPNDAYDMSYSDVNVLTTIELASLLDGLETLLPGSKINSVDVSNVSVSNLVSSSSNIKTSYILNATITNKLKAQLSVPEEAYVESRNDILKNNEIDAFMGSLDVLFGSEATINNLNISDLTIAKINNNIDTINGSYILRQTITDKIEDQQASGIIIPISAYESTMLTSDEIKHLFNSITLMIDSNQSISNISLITSCNISTFASNALDIADSLILRASISSKVYNVSMLKIPSSAMDISINDYHVINKEEFVKLFAALNSVYSGQLNDSISIDTIRINDSTIIADSIIMRTTVTQSLKLEINGSEHQLYTLANYYSIENSYNDVAVSYMVLTKQETIKLIDSFNVLLNGNAGLTVTLDINTLVNALTDIETLLGSATSEIAISDYLLSLPIMALPNIAALKEVENIDVYAIPTGNETLNYEKLTHQSIINIINEASSI